MISFNKLIIFFYINIVKKYSMFYNKQELKITGRNGINNGKRFD